MSVLDIIGTDQPVYQGRKLVWSYFTGESEGIVYKGERTTVKALYESYKALSGLNPMYDGLDYDPGKGLATLTITTVADGEPIYELSANEVSNDIATHTYFESLDSAAVAAVLSAVDNHLTAPATFTALQKTLHAYLIRGMNEYMISQYVLRETKNVSKRSLVTVSYNKVNEIDTPPDTVAVNTLIGSLPAGEWIKKSPIVRQVGTRRWQIITEWWWTLKASKIIYGGTYEPTE